MTVKALTFDTYGTVVDWRGSVLGELEAFGAARRLGLDWSAFLADWRSCYRPGMEKVNSGEWPWTTVDAIYRRRLDELLQAHQIRGLDTAEVEHLSRVWWRLKPWPDSVPGLARLPGLLAGPRRFEERRGDHRQQHPGNLAVVTHHPDRPARDRGEPGPRGGRQRGADPDGPAKPVRWMPIAVVLVRQWPGHVQEPQLWDGVYGRPGPRPQ